MTRFIRLHPGAQKGNAANYWSLFEPHYKQNLSANPKRTAKSFVLLIGCIQSVICSKNLFYPAVFSCFSQRTTNYFNNIHTGRMEKFQRQEAPENSSKIPGESGKQPNFIGLFAEQRGSRTIFYGHYPSRR
jgi:hypothetical protein